MRCQSSAKMNEDKLDDLEDELGREFDCSVMVEARLNDDVSSLGAAPPTDCSRALGNFLLGVRAGVRGGSIAADAKLPYIREGTHDGFDLGSGVCEITRTTHDSIKKNHTLQAA